MGWPVGPKASCIRSGGVLVPHDFRAALLLYARPRAEGRTPRAGGPLPVHAHPAPEMLPTPPQMRMIRGSGVPYAQERKTAGGILPSTLAWISQRLHSAKATLSSAAVYEPHPAA